MKTRWLILLLLLPVAAAAQPRERLRERVKAVRIARLVEALNLDQQAATRLMPVLDKGYDEIADIARDSGAARRELRVLVTTDKPDEARMNQLIDRLAANKARADAVSMNMLRDARRVLPTRQSALLVLVLPEIDREIRERMRRAVRKGPPQLGPQDSADDSP